MFENPRRGRQARNFTTNVPKIIDFKWSSEQIFSENCRWVPLIDQQQLTAKVLRDLSNFNITKKVYLIFESKHSHSILKHDT